MILHKKIIPVSHNIDGVDLKCHDYSTIVDAIVYEGGYGNYLCQIYYTTTEPIDMDENKSVSVIFFSERSFNNSKLIIPDEYYFLKSVKIEKDNHFIFISEKKSIAELRDNKIKNVIQ